MKKEILYLAFLSLHFLLPSCKTIRVSSPPKVPPHLPQMPIQNSVIKINASVAESDIVRLMKENIKNPVVPDNDPIVINANILTEHSITTEELLEEIIKPYRPGYYKEVSTKAYRTVRKSFSCALSPWKWGTCWKDVVEAVWVTTKVWVEPQLKESKWITVKALKWFDKIYKTECKIHYPTYLDDLALTFNKNEFELTVKIRTDIKFDYQENLIPFGPSVKMKSVLEKEIYSAITVRGAITVASPGKLIVTIDKGATKFNLGTLPPLFPGLDGGNLESLLRFRFESPLKILLETLAEKTINKAILEAIENNQDKLNFREKINQIVMYIGEPKPLAENIWLNIKPIAILSGQLNGKNKKLYYSAGLEFIPEVEFSAKPPAIKPSAIPFRVINMDDVSQIKLKGKVKLNVIEDSLKVLLHRYVGTVNALKKNVRIDKVEIYNTTGNKLAIQVRITRKRLFKSYTFFANAYLTASLKYNNLHGVFTLDDVRFTVETQSALLTSILNPFVTDIVAKLIQNEANFSIDDNMRSANKAIQNSTIDLPYGTMKLNFNPIFLSDPYLTDTTLETFAIVEGKIDFEAFRGAQALYSNSFPNDQLKIGHLYRVKRKKLYQSNYKINREGNVISMSPNTLNDTISDFDRIDFLSNSTGEITIANKMAEGISSLKIGDTILLEEKGKITKKILNFEDIPGEGEEILISLNSGKINRMRMPADAITDAEQRAQGFVKTDTITVLQALDYIDKKVVLKGKVKCYNTVTDRSGELIGFLMLENCHNALVEVKIYFGSVSDFHPEVNNPIDKTIYLTGTIEFENGEPIMKIKQNNMINYN